MLGFSPGHGTRTNAAKCALPTWPVRFWATVALQRRMFNRGMAVSERFRKDSVGSTMPGHLLADLPEIALFQEDSAESRRTESLSSRHPSHIERDCCRPDPELQRQLPGVRVHRAGREGHLRHRVQFRVGAAAWHRPNRCRVFLQPNRHHHCLLPTYGFEGPARPRTNQAGIAQPSHSPHRRGI